MAVAQLWSSELRAHQPQSYQESFFLWLHWVFLAVRRLSLVVASEGYSLVAVLWLPIVVASLVAKHRLSALGLQ